MSRRLVALWMSGTWLQFLPRPGWSGYMRNMNSGITEYGTCAVLPLPFVNMDPSNLSTIYTCLQYVAEQRSTCRQSRITVTLGQPLYAKQAKLSWLRGRIVVFPASSFDSEDSTISRVRSVPLIWPKVVWKQCRRPYVRRTVSFTR